MTRSHLLAALATLALFGCAGDSASAPELPPDDMPGEESRFAAPDMEQDGAGGELVFEDEAPDYEVESEGGESAVFAGRVAATKQDGKRKGEPVTTWKRSTIVPNASTLQIGDDEELPLVGLQASVRVDGFRARVLLDLYYRNDRDRQYEGTFKLRLPNEASPHFLAFGPTVLQSAELDPSAFLSAEQVRAQGTRPDELMAARAESWTGPKAAQVVTKEKAAFAYGETVRRAVDPALMEWSGAGVFSSRVFPLEPGKLHRIVVGYDVDLVAAGDDLEYRLDLPVVPKAVVDLDVAESEAGHTVTPSAEAARGDGRARYRFVDPSERTLTVRLTGAGAAPSLLTGVDAGTGPYTATSLIPTLPVGDAVGSATSRAVFLVDTSLSSNPERFNVWLALLEAILTENRDTLTEFAVLFFNVETFWWQKKYHPNTSSNTSAVLRYAKSIVLEGATDLGEALTEAVGRSWRSNRLPADLFLLSDGAATWGEGDRHALGKRLGHDALFAYRTGFAGTDVAALEHLSRESGGAVFSVVGEAEVAAAATAHRARPWRLNGVSLEGTRDVLLAGRPQALFPGQRLRLAARGVPAEGAALVLELQQGQRTERVQASLPAATDSPLAPRIYGQLATGQLEEFSLRTEETAAAYARHFRVTGSTCSLLMLESPEDYARFGIKPLEDALVVKQSEANAVVAEALGAIGETLGDPKAAFLAFVERLAKTPGVTFEAPLALRQALARLPREAFSIVPPPLTCTIRSWDDVPGPLHEQLVSKQLSYDALSAEALRRLEANRRDDALKALSSLVENSPGDTVLARDVGYSALEWGLGGHAYHLLRRVAHQRPSEPQTYSALGACLEAMGRTDLALAYYELGLAGTWSERFGAFRQIHGLRTLRFLRRIASGELKTALPDYAAARLKTVAAEFDLGNPDLVVMISWNTDRTDVDLHVQEPSGEECYYSNAKTKIGGALTQDVTTGYGPEMYVLKKAPQGTFEIRAKYFASDANRAGARTKVFATVVRRWGTSTEEVTKKVVTLAYGKEMHAIATVTVP